MGDVQDRLASVHGPAWQVRAARIARRFYLDGASKTDIAAETGLSRFKVARILDEALAEGLVEVTVRLPADIDADLSAALAQRYQPAQALVVRCADGRDDGGASMRAAVARAAARLLGELVSGHDVLGLTCSRTVAAATEALSALEPCPVVQLSGTLAGPDVEAGSVESVRRAARVGGGKAFPIYAPMLLPDARTAEALARQPTIRRVLDEFAAVNVALVAVGAWERGLSTVWDSAEPAERRGLAAAGAVGEIAGRVFDARGSAVSSELDGRVLGVDLDRLRRIPQVIGVVHDPRRAAAAHAALSGRLVDFVVCDDALARALLAGRVAPDRPNPDSLARPAS